MAGRAGSGAEGEQGRASRARSRAAPPSAGRGERRAALQAQRRKLAGACRRAGWQLLEPADAARSAKGRGREQPRRTPEGADAQVLVAATQGRPAQALGELTSLLTAAHRQGWALVALATTTPAGERTITLRATFAACEQRLSSLRRRAALARARARGVRLGRPPTMSEYVIERIKRERTAGKSLAEIANGLNADRIPTAQGGQRWYPATIRHTLNRTR